VEAVGYFDVGDGDAVGFKNTAAFGYVGYGYGEGFGDLVAGGADEEGGEEGSGCRWCRR
jgi:hypothetical protein